MEESVVAFVGARENQSNVRFYSCEEIIYYPVTSKKECADFTKRRAHTNTLAFSPDGRNFRIFLIRSTLKKWHRGCARQQRRMNLEKGSDQVFAQRSWIRPFFWSRREARGGGQRSVVRTPGGGRQDIAVAQLVLGHERRFSDFKLFSIHRSFSNCCAQPTTRFFCVQTRGTKLRRRFPLTARTPFPTSIASSSAC